MKHPQVTRNHQQTKNDTPLVRGILQRGAVRSQNEKSSHYSESRFHQDFSQLPVTSSGDLGVASSRVPIQAKMIVGQVNDRYEQEADRIAAAVVQQIHAPGVATPDGQAVQRSLEEDKIRMKPMKYLQREAMEEDDELQMKPMAKFVGTEGGEVSADFESEINLARGGGQPLAPELQMQMGLAMGADFSRVRVHTDERADGLNRAVGARAFTTGQDLFFREGAYQPGSRGGQELIAHELSHVVQQSETGIQQTSRQPTTMVQRYENDKFQMTNPVPRNGRLEATVTQTSLWDDRSTYTIHTSHQKHLISSYRQQAVTAHNSGDLNTNTIWVGNDQQFNQGFNDFVTLVMEYIMRHGNKPPANWRTFLKDPNFETDGAGDDYNVHSYPVDGSQIEILTNDEYEAMKDVAKAFYQTVPYNQGLYSGVVNRTRNNDPNVIKVIQVLGLTPQQVINNVEYNIETKRDLDKFGRHFPDDLFN